MDMELLGEHEFVEHVATLPEKEQTRSLPSQNFATSFVGMGRRARRDDLVIVVQRQKLLSPWASFDEVARNIGLLQAQVHDRVTQRPVTVDEVNSVDTVNVGFIDSSIAP